MYNKRTWLSPDTYDHTSSVVAFEGEVTYKDKRLRDAFLEVSDCRNKIRLHLTSDDTIYSFTERIRLLRDELNLFIEYLEKEGEKIHE